MKKKRKLLAAVTTARKNSQLLTDTLRSAHESACVDGEVAAIVLIDLLVKMNTISERILYLESILSERKS